MRNGERAREMPTITGEGIVPECNESRLDSPFAIPRSNLG
jgi:hypothetical protein